MPLKAVILSLAVIISKYNNTSIADSLNVDF